MRSMLSSDWLVDADYDRAHIESSLYVLVRDLHLQEFSVTLGSNRPKFCRIRSWPAYKCLCPVGHGYTGN